MLEPLRKTNPHTGETWLYRYYDKRGRLLYVGQSGDLLNRMRIARKEIWWHAVKTASAKLYPTRQSALIAEKWNIQRYKPPLNSRHASRKGPEATEHSWKMWCKYSRPIKAKRNGKKTQATALSRAVTSGNER